MDPASGGIQRGVRALALALVLAVPFGVVSLAASRVVAPLSARAALLLTELVARLPAPAAAAEETLDFPSVPELAPLPVAAPSSAAKSASRSRAKPPSALSVSAATVLKLAASGHRPRGRFVPATNAHPAGLQLSGVAALGIGVEEGDILVEAAGAPARNAADVIASVLRARAARAPWISGVIWRAGKRIPIRVEQPYAESEPAASPAGTPPPRG